MADLNIYCDESNHLEKDGRLMVLGAIYCSKEKVPTINKRVRDIKIENGLSSDFEIKWTKVTERRLNLYLDLVNYFFDIEDIGLRAIIADKSKVNYEKFKHDHDGWYYKMYYLLLTKMIRSTNRYKICLDRKDTLGKEKIAKLKEVLCKKEFDFEQKIIQEIREVHSDKVQMVQLVDLLIGAIQFNLSSKNSDTENKAKRQIVELIKKRSRLTLTTNTLPSEPKLNLFFWDGGKKE